MAEGSATSPPCALSQRRPLCVKLRSSRLFYLSLLTAFLCFSVAGDMERKLKATSAHDRRGHGPFPTPPLNERSLTALQKRRSIQAATNFRWRQNLRNAGAGLGEGEGEGGADWGVSGHVGPSAVGEGVVPNVDELLAQQMEEIREAEGQVTPERCAAAIDQFVQREGEKDLARPGRERGKGKEAVAGVPGSEKGATEVLRRLLFFLHVPRTGGRTYHVCFLKALFPVHERCPKSYDTLRFNVRVPSCRLLATHTDYSLMERLPAGDVSVVTNMRAPVDRILSSYEFAMETAARSLGWNARPKAGETPVEARRRARRQLPPVAKTMTRNVWPWSLLLPMLENDLWERRNGSARGPPDPPGSEGRSSYEKGHLLMPLREFVEHPSVRDLLHNGALFHVLGLTQNSILKEAPLLRACANRHQGMGRSLVELAKGRLDGMLHIGLTAQHKETALQLLAVLKKSMRDPAFTGPDARLMRLPQRKLPHSTAPGQGPLPGTNFSASLPKVAASQYKTGGTLFSFYTRCIQLQKRRYKSRRDTGLRLLGPGVEFSHSTRAKVPSDVIDRIKKLNLLDQELVDYAQGRFAQQREALGGRLRRMEEEERGQGAEGKEKAEAWPSWDVALKASLPAKRRRLLGYTRGNRGVAGTEEYSRTKLLWSALERVEGEETGSGQRLRWRDVEDDIAVALGTLKPRRHRNGQGEAGKMEGQGEAGKMEGQGDGTLKPRVRSNGQQGARRTEGQEGDALSLTVLRHETLNSSDSRCFARAKGWGETQSGTGEVARTAKGPLWGLWQRSERCHT